MNRKHLKRAAMMAPLLAIAVLVAACSKNVTTSVDQLGCVYGDQNHGQRLIKQIPASSNPVSVDKADTVVYIPASNRFYNVVKDDNTRDPRAQPFYLGYAQGSVPIEVQGQIRFRFNPDLACQWYAKHGRRNADASGDLGFNVRGGNEADTGWARWLAENFGPTMQQAVQEISGRYDWPYLVYNYPVNADGTGAISKGKKAGDLARIAYGKALGDQFTKDLNQNLGGNYFCGISSSTKCAPVEFQVSDVTTQDTSLMTARAQVEKDRQALQNTQDELKIGREQEKSAVEQQRILEAQLKADQLQAQDALVQAEIKNANCISLARYGLDCQGNRPQGGVTVNQSGK